MTWKTIYISFFFFTIKLSAIAQNCTGTLGNPVVDITFGFGPNPGPPLTQVPATYKYSATDCFDEGYYAVRSSTFFCFANSWNTAPSDHTHTNADGYFLLINSKPGTFDIYVDTIRGLCPNTNFEAGVWITNLMKSAVCTGDVDPKVTLTVTDLAGTVLAQYTTGPVSRTSGYVAWNRYGVEFLAPSSGSVIFKLTEIGPGCSNDLGIDDIAFQRCTGKIVASLANSQISQVLVCENNEPSYQLVATYNGLTNPVIQWQSSSDGRKWDDIAGATATTYLRTPTLAGSYFYRFSISDNNNQACGFYSNYITIEVQALFSQATNYVFGCYGSPMQLFADAGASYEWTGPNGFASTAQGPVIPSVDFSNTGMYVVKVTSDAGCSVYDTTNIVVRAAPVAVITSPADVSLCEGDSARLVVSGSTRYRWSPAAGLSNDTISNPIARPTVTTRYTAKVFNQTNCYDTASVNIVVWKRPKADAGPDKFTFKNRAVILQGKVDGSNVTYSWSPATFLDNTSIERPKASPPASITYTLTVTSNSGCGVASDDVKVEVIDKMFIPSAFTPNNDGLNDVWEIVTFEEHANATVQVFNRWGQTVYFNKGLNYKPWDGTYNGLPVPSGTYVYVIDLHNNTRILTGTVTVVR